MADIVVSITVPDAYVQRLKNALDHLDTSGLGYVVRFKNMLRQATKDYIVKSETSPGGIFIDDGIVI